jgi:uncharacterized protein YbjT (DUF2867 family)
MESKASLRTALADATAAVYLYHAVGSTADYAEREAQVARDFHEAADEAGIGRIVYLGGIVPKAAPSRHLESRRVTGEVLRQGRPPTIELRASMVIGYPSASFAMIRDLAVGLPLLALPGWLDNESCPISVCDVAPAIALACVLPSAQSTWYELPGPECVTHRQLIEFLTGPTGTHVLDRRIAAITPRVATLGIAAVSNVAAGLARELVMGLTSDLRPTGPVFWDHVGRPRLRPLRHAMVDAISDQAAAHSPAPETRRRIINKTLEWLERCGVQDRG